MRFRKWRCPKPRPRGYVPLDEPTGEVDDVVRGRGGEGADIGTARGTGRRDGLVGDHVAGDEVERRRLVRRGPRRLDAGPDLAPNRRSRGVTAIIDTINARTSAGTPEVATGAFDGNTNAPASMATRPKTEPIPNRVSASRVGRDRLVAQTTAGRVVGALQVDHDFDARRKLCTQIVPLDTPICTRLATVCPAT